MRRLPWMLGLLLAWGGIAGAQEKPTAEGQASERPNVFAAARLTETTRRVLAAVQPLFRDKKFAEAEKVLAEAVRQQPEVAVNYYNLACAQARQGKLDEALANLRQATERGFGPVAQYEQDADLAPLRERKEFAELLAALGKKLAETPAFKLEPGTVENGKARVGLANAGWNPQSEQFHAFFRFAEDDPRRTADAVKDHGPAGELIRTWQKAGTASGLFGILYDNHDRQHSPLPLDQFPQLSAIEFCPEAQKEQFDNGHAGLITFNQPTFGNSSTALTGGPYWRSQTRIAQTNARLIGIQARQYLTNQLYFYPEHRDYDPGRNGKDDAYGDVYPANTPYVITSQGSSGSDQVFLHAVACTLAAFQPATREALVKHNLLMPTVQQVFRRANKQVEKEEDYLTSKAHPPVFQGEQLDVEKMVRLAHEMEPGALPPLAAIRVLLEDEPTPGVDYFDAGPAEKLFDTPCAIARIHRTAAQMRTLTVSALDSKDFSGRPLTWHWKVLLGNADAIQIKPQRPDSSIVELQVPWHARFPIAPDAKMETNRVDIAVFAHNGVQYSPPAIVSIYFPDSETRTYADGRIQSIEYRSQANGGNYSDPMIYVPRDWRDEYQYAGDKLLGWKRTRGEKTEEFTRHGHLIAEKDDLGRPAVAKKVRYAPVATQPHQAPKLEQVVTESQVKYVYASPEDRLGKAEELGAE